MKKEHIIRRFIVLFAFFLYCNFSFGQAINVSGSITDKSGSPLPGVTVLIKGTQKGAISNLDGRYNIQADAASTLVFSFIGYTTQEVNVEGKAVIDIILLEESKQLDEVIVIGYGTQKKSDRTGSVYNVKAEDLNGGVITNPAQAIQGKVAGVNISKKGGDPNAGFAIQIRGAAGFWSNTQPLVVIDGVPGASLSTISPEDIESFNILKDASAGAIYGSRASNGVIIVTTKKSKQGAQIEYSAYTSFDKISKKLEFLDANDIRDYVQERNITGFVDNGANTDWQSEIFRTGHTQSHNIAVTNASDNFSYRLSYNYLASNGVVINSGSQSHLGRINLTQKALNNKLTIDAAISGRFNTGNYINYGGGMGSSNVLYQMYQRNPTDPVMKDGKYFEFQRDFNYNNPVAIAKLIQNESDNKDLSGNVKVSYELIKGLTVSTNLGVLRNDGESFYFEPTNIFASGNLGYGTRRYYNWQSKILETLISYTKTINDKHNLNFITGYSYQEDYISGIRASASGALSNYLKSNSLGHFTTINPAYDIESNRNITKLISFFGRAIYNFDSKYIVTATVRRDGSSKFGSNNEWGLFPSLSIAWDIKRESFMDNMDFVNQLKLRAGFGFVGNQEIPAAKDVYFYRASAPSFNFDTGADAILFSLGHNENPNIKWEENREYNFGIDYAIMNNRIQGSLEYYIKSTYDILAPFAVPVPPNVASTTWANVGVVDNKGFEFTAEGYAIDKSDFKWKAQFNFATNKQILSKLSNDTYAWTEADKKRLYLSGRGLVGAHNWAQYLMEGEQVGTFYMPKFAGLSQDGKFLFYTAAGGVTRDINVAERRIVGNANPKFIVGWSNIFNYKNFDLSISLRGLYGNKVLNVTRMVFSNPQTLPTLNAMKDVLKEIDKGLTDSPKLSDYYLEDASFIKIDNLTLGYNFKTAKINWLKSLRVYITSNNLLTLTKYSGLDPEMTYSGLEYGIEQYDIYPKTRTFTFGVDVKF